MRFPDWLYAWKQKEQLLCMYLKCFKSFFVLFDFSITFFCLIIYTTGRKF